MKPILSYVLLLGVFILNSGAGCGSNATDPQPDNFQSLLGKWQIQGFTQKVTKQNGQTVVDPVDLKARGVVIIWEFFKDGRMVATQDGKSQEVRWKLKVTQLDAKDINDGTLTLISPEFKTLAESFGQNGDLEYEIGTSSLNGLTIMNLTVDATKASDYQKHIITYTYHKL